MSQLEKTYIITECELKFLLSCSDEMQNKGCMMDLKEFVGCVFENISCIDKVLKDVKRCPAK